MGAIVSKINSRAKFFSDEGTWLQVQENIKLPLSNNITRNCDYNLNDTSSLVSGIASVNQIKYDSPKDERRGMKIAQVPISRYVLNDFVKDNELDLQPDDGFYPISRYVYPIYLLSEMPFQALKMLLR